MQIVSFPSCCTAKVLVGLGISGYSKNEIVRILKAVSADYRDNDMITAVTTERQNKAGSAEFLTELGFKVVFEGDKKDGVQRNKATGALTLWAIKPRDWAEGKAAYIKKHEIVTNKQVVVGSLALQARKMYSAFSLVDMKRHIPSECFNYRNFMLANRIRSHVRPNQEQQFITLVRERYGYFPDTLAINIMTFDDLKRGITNWHKGYIK